MIGRAVGGANRVLDLGAGRGQTAQAVATAGCVIVGVEPDPDLLVEAAATTGASGVLLCRGDGRLLPFTDSAFDAALMIEVLEHIRDPGTVLDEIRRVLRPGASLCIAVPTWYTERVFSALHPDYARNATHVNTFRRSELVAELERRDLRVVAIETHNLAPALAWFAHALLRTPADHTGLVLRRRWIDYGAAGVVRVLRAAPLLGHLVRAAERRFGKSLYILAEVGAQNG